MRPSLSLPAVRLSSFYAVHFAAIGIVMPFWPVWLEDRGLGATEIGYILALGMAVKVIGNPLVAHVADRRGARKGVMIVLALAALAAFALYEPARGFWPILAVSTLFYLAWPATLPLAESLTMLTAHEHDLDYGRIRLWGSITFIAASVVTGWVLKTEPVSIVFWMALAMVALKVPVCLALPKTDVPAARQGTLLVAEVLRIPGFPVFVLAAALIQSSHAVYYGFATLHWLDAGHDETTIGWLWAEGVVAEIILFMVGRRLLDKIGPIGLLGLGAAAAMARWPAMALSTDISVLAVVQALHALTYGAAHLGAIHFMTRAVPRHLSATAQALYAAVVMGLAFGPAMLAAGTLYETVGAGAYLAMAVMAVCALGLTAFLAWRAGVFAPVRQQRPPLN